MHPKLSLTVQLDLDRAAAVVVVEGTVTRENVAALRAVVDRVRAFDPVPRVTVDASAAEVPERAVLADVLQDLARLGIEWPVEPTPPVDLPQAAA